MKTIDLNDALRKAVDEYLTRNYGVKLPASKSYLIDEKNDYLYLNTDTEDCFYIPKKEIKL
jgi:hypothetical protein